MSKTHAQAAASLVALCVLLTACADDPDTDSGPTTGASPSTGMPVGPLVLFEWYQSGSERKSLFTTSADATASAHAVTKASTSASKVHADWSRDGRRFAYEVLADAGPSSVWIANADGTEASEAIACDAAPCLQMSWPAWSPDGDSIMVVQYDEAAGDDWGPSHLIEVDLASGERSVLASTEDGATAFYLPTWSPDGERVALHLESYPDAAENDVTGSVVVVFDTDPTTMDPGVAITPPEFFAGYAKWHPTEDRILFASWDLSAFQGDEPSQLFEVRPDGSGLRQITNLDAATDGRPGEASWTPDGAAIIAAIGQVLSSQVDDVKIAYVDPTTGHVQLSTQSGAMPKRQPEG